MARRLAKHAFATLVLLASAVTATAEDFSSLVRGQGIDPSTEQFISVVRNGSGAYLVKYDLDPFRKGPALYGEDFVFTNAQQQTTSGRIGFKVRPGKPMPRAPSPPLPAGALPHEIFEFFSKHVVHDKSMAGGVLIESVVPARYEIAGLGYHVDTVFDDRSVDFQAFGLTSDEWFRLQIDWLTPDGSVLLERRWMIVNIYDLDRPPVLAIRGTESVKDALSDANPTGVGYNQFVNNRSSVESWLRRVSAPEAFYVNPNIPAIQFKPHVTGHSLGGALTQWVASSYSETGGRLGQVVTFNAAGIARETGAHGANHFRSANVDQVTHYVVSGDPVSMGGEAFLPPPSRGNLGGQPGWVLFSYTKKSTSSQLEKHSVPVLMNERFVEGDWLLNPIKNPNPLAPPPTVKVYETPEGSFNNPDFTYLPDSDYFAFLNGLARSGGGTIAAGAVFRADAEAFRQDIGQAILNIGTTFDLTKPVQTWKPSTWNAILNMTKKKLGKSPSNLNKTGGSGAVLSANASNELGFWDASADWPLSAWGASESWRVDPSSPSTVCAWNAMDGAWGPDQWSKTMDASFPWPETPSWECAKWLGAGSTGNPNDKTAPFCQLESLPPEPIRGAVTLTVHAWDNDSKVSRVVVKINGQSLGEVAGPRSDDYYRLNWSPAADSKGLYSVEAFCYDNGIPPNEKSDWRLMSVNTKPEQDGAPQLAFLDLVQNRPYAGPTKIRVKATDNQGVAVELAIQGSEPQGLTATSCGADCFEFDWRMSRGGKYTVTAVARELRGTTLLVSNLRADNVLVDLAAPAVSISSPANGSTLSTRVPLLAAAQDDLGIARLEIQAKAASDTAFRTLGVTSSSSYADRWCPATTGVHTLKAIAQDVAGKITEATIQVQVAVDFRCTIPATAMLASPGQGARLQGTVQLETTRVASDVIKVEFAIESVRQVVTSKTAAGTFSWPWDTTNYNGRRRITLTAFKGETAVDSESIEVDVANPPPVVIPPPAIQDVKFRSTGAGRVWGATPVTVSATAAPQRTMERVEFYLDDRLQDTKSGSGGTYVWTWETDRWERGPHKLAVVAFDNTGALARKEFPLVVMTVGKLNVYTVPSDQGWCSFTQALDSPKPRSRHSMAGVPGGVLLFGGKPAAGSFTNELWFFNGIEWTELTLPARRPGIDWPRAVGKSTMVYDEGRGRVVLGGDWPYLWEWDVTGRYWIRIDTKIEFRNDSQYNTWSMAYDRGAKKVYMHGDPISLSFQLWSWDGSTLRVVPGIYKNEWDHRALPPFEVMYYQPEGLQVASNRDFWSSDPYNHDRKQKNFLWYQRSYYDARWYEAANPFPLPLQGLAVADDRQGGTYFLVDGWFAYLKDLAGNGFKYRALRMYARRYSAMAWDEGRRQLVVFGGDVNGVPEPGTWIYGPSTCPVYTYETDERNDPMTIAPIAPVQATPGQNVAFTVTATDPDGDAIQLSASGLPAGAQFVPSNGRGRATGVFTWRVPSLPPGTSRQDYDLSFTAIDPWGKSVSREALLRVCNILKECTSGPVNHAPEFDPLPDQTVQAGALLAFTIGAQDFEEDLMVLTATGLPAGAVFEQAKPIERGYALGVFRWAAPATPQTVTVTFKAQEKEIDEPVPTGLSSYKTVRITVTAAPPPAKKSVAVQD